LVDRRRHRSIVNRALGHCRRGQCSLHQRRVRLRDRNEVRIGKLPGVAAIAADLAAVLDTQGFVALPISFVHGQLAGALPGPLRDPFDRMLIAQAMHEDMMLVSNEASFSAYGVRRLW
jgi:PIN domain nuclease of toxin-antitoxin system